MTLQQLLYLVAIDEHRHFARAAEACHVTQATLSMMVAKLEGELNAQLFDRSRTPVVPTPLGARVVAQAREVLRQADHLKALVAEEREALAGELRLGVIPTLAPYLLPEFFRAFTEGYPAVHLQVSEHTTEVLIQKLKAGLLDMAVLATPLHEAALREEPLFYEPYWLYAGEGEPLSEAPLRALKLDPARLWMLEEGHCLRDQVAALCELGRRQRVAGPLAYQAGSLETLRNLVDQRGGYTVLPELSTLGFDAARRARLHAFAEPAPVREIGLVCAQAYPKERLLRAVAGAVQASVPERLWRKGGRVLAVR